MSGFAEGKQETGVGWDFGEGVMPGERRQALERSRFHYPKEHFGLSQKL